ncbi:MAG: HAD family hydrolase [Lachnospiraceae bacterium]|nr:HAD family hydrolase [Lachnospiraceae bacterium]
MKYDGILFDLDGTLWNATDAIRISWNMAVKNFSELNDRELTSEELKGVMGLPMNEIAKKLFPALNNDKQLEVLDKCCEVENNYLAEHGGILYPELEETLEYLCRSYKLFIVSNGQSGYIQSFLKAHDLKKYFSDFQNWGDNKVSKGENNKLIISRNNLEKAIYVGDTKGDALSAQTAGIPFVFARYGFGDVDKYDYVIDSFSELKNIF